VNDDERPLADDLTPDTRTPGMGDRAMVLGGRRVEAALVTREAPFLGSLSCSGTGTGLPLENDQPGSLTPPTNLKQMSTFYYEQCGTCY
jgi:hypothetical protein